MERGDEKPGIKLEETKILTSSPISSWQIDGRTMETVTDFKAGCPLTINKSITKLDYIKIKIS